MALFYSFSSTLLYYGSTSLDITLPCMALLYLNLHNSTKTILLSTGPYITLPWIYFNLLDSSLLNHKLYFTLLDSTLLYYASISLYIILQWLYFNLLHSTLLYHGFTSLYITLPWLYFDLLDPT